MSVFFNSENKSSAVADKIRDWFKGLMIEKVTIYSGKSNREWDEASLLIPKSHSVDVSDSLDRNGMIDIVIGWGEGTFKFSFYAEDVDEQSLEQNNFDRPMLHVDSRSGLSCIFRGKWR